MAGIQAVQDLGLLAPWQALFDPTSRHRYYWNSTTNEVTHERPSSGNIDETSALEYPAPRPSRVDRAFLRRTRRDFYCWHEFRCLSNELVCYNELRDILAWPDAARFDDEEVEYWAWFQDLRKRLKQEYLWEHVVPGVLSFGFFLKSSRWSQYQRSCPLPIDMCNSHNPEGSPWVLEADGVYRSSLVMSTPEPGQAWGCNAAATGDAEPQGPETPVSAAGEKLDCMTGVVGAEEAEGGQKLDVAGSTLAGQQPSSPPHSLDQPDSPPTGDQHEQQEEQQLELERRNSTFASEAVLFEPGAWDEHRYGASAAAFRQRRGFALPA